MGLAIFIVVLLVVLGGIGGLVYFFWSKIKTVTASSNEAMIITGANLKPDKGLENVLINPNTGKSVKIVQGGSVWKKRFQTVEYISLQSMQLDVSGDDVPTKEGVPVSAKVVVMLKVDSDLAGLSKYAEQWLGKKQNEIKEELEAILGAVLRSILSSMTVEEINQDRNEFSKSVQEVAEPQLLAMGFKILSLNLSSLSDKNNYIENLGLEKIAEIKRISSIGVAENEKTQSNAVNRLELENAKVLQEIEKEKSDLHLEKESRILENKLHLEKQEKEKELALAKIEIQKLTETQKAEKAKELELTSQNAEIANVNAKRKLELERIDAESEKVKIDLEAYNKMKVNEVEANKLISEGKAKSEVILAEGEAEAKSIRLKGEAKAEIEAKIGKIIAENKRLEAEAISQNASFMLSQEVIKILPQLVEANSKAFSSIDSVRIYDSGSTDSDGGLSKYSNDVASNLLKSQDLLKDFVGIDLSEIIHNQSVKGNTHTVIVPDKGSISAMPVGKSPSIDSDSDVIDTVVTDIPDVHSVDVDSSVSE